MAQSFIEMRKQALGLNGDDGASASVPSATPQPASGSSFIQNRMKALGLTQDPPLTSYDSSSPYSQENQQYSDLMGQAQKSYQTAQQDAQQLSDQAQMEQAEKTMDTMPKADAQLPGRNLPFIGKILSGLDTIASNPISQAVAEYTIPNQPYINETPSLSNLIEGRMPTARDEFLKRAGQEPSTGVSKFLGENIAPFFVPGGGLGGGELHAASDQLLNKLAPGLQGVGRAAVQGGMIGAPMGFGAEYAQGQGDLGNAALNAIGGAALGAGLGTAGSLAGKGLAALADKYAGTKLGDALGSFFNRGADTAAQPTEDILALPMGQRDARLAAAQERANLPYGSEPLATYGESQTLALPEGTYQPQRLRIESNPDVYLNRAMEQAKPVVNERMTPPYENPNELAKWIHDRLGVDDLSLNEVRKLPYEDMRQLAEGIRSHLSVADEAFKAAREQGYDLPKLLDRQAPNAAERVAQNAQERAYGVYPDQLPKIRQPKGFKTYKTGQSESPITKSGVTGPIKPSVKLNNPKDFIEARKQAVGSPEAPNSAPGVQGYAGNAIPFRQATGQTDKTIGRNQVVNNMRKNLGVTIDTGRLVSPSKGTLGQFKVDPEVIRTRMAEDLQTISHEVGHHFDKKYSLQDPAYQNELTNLTNTVNPNHLGNYQPHQHFEEAIAEYFRTRLTDPDQAKALAPNFTKFVDSKLSPKELRGLEASANDINTWINQGHYHQAVGLLDFENNQLKPSFKEKVSETWNKWQRTMVDDLDPLRLAERALKGIVGLADQSLYKTARLSRGIAREAEEAVKHGVYLNKQKISEGLAEITKPLQEIGMKEKDFATYLAVKHAQDLKAMGKRVPFDDNQMNAVLSKWDNNPVAQKAQQQIIQYNDALLKVLEDAQILSPTAIKEMRQKYPNYVPFMRYFDDDAIAGFKNGGYGAAKGFANITNPIKRMTEEGSTRTIVNPLESMVKNTFLTMNAAAKNKVGLQLAELSKIDGAGAFVEHVGEGGASPHEHVLSVYQQGEKNSFKVRNPDLYNAMLSLDTESTNSLLRFLGGAANMLRAGATLTPDFMIRNVFRDVTDAMTTSVKYGFNPIDVFKGLSHVLKKDDIFRQYINSGGAMGNLQAIDRDATRESMDAVFKATLKDRTMNVVTSPKELAKMLTGITPIQKTVGLLRHGAELSELGTRVGMFNKVLQKTGNAAEAAYQARDLMDFQRAGSAIRPANKIVAFLNANIQGMDRARRQFLSNPASFMVRAFTTLMLPTIGIHYWNQNSMDADTKKIYDNIPQWQKDTFYVVHIPGTQQFLRIPKPFELGMLFSTGTERFLRWANDHDPQATKGYGKALLDTFTPPSMITALQPLLESITNYSFFKGQSIIPKGESGLQAKDQYGIYTSETAKKTAQLMADTPLKNSNFASPRIIDNLIQGYTGGLGRYAVTGIDKAIQAGGAAVGQQIPKPSQSILEHQPFSSFLATTSGGGQVRQDFYDKWDELSKEFASSKRDQGEPNADYFAMKPAYNAMSNLVKEYKFIQNNPNISSDEKRAKLDDLDKFMNQVAAESLSSLPSLNKK